MPTRKKRRHRKRKTYKRGGMVLKSVQTTSDGYVDSKIMPSTDNKALFDKDKFVPSVNTPWRLRSNEAKSANNVLFMVFDKKEKVKQKTMFIVLNNEMEKQQADLYNEIDLAADDALIAAYEQAQSNIVRKFLLTYFPTPGTVGAAAAPVAPSAVAEGDKAEGGDKDKKLITPAEIENLFKKETLWPKDKDNRKFYMPGTLLGTLKTVYKKEINQLNEIRQLMYEHQTSIYHLIDDKMVETFMDAVDNTNKKYSSIYKKGDTTTYDNIRYVIMWILFKVDIEIKIDIV